MAKRGIGHLLFVVSTRFLVLGLIRVGCDPHLPLIRDCLALVLACRQAFTEGNWLVHSRVA